MVLIPNVLSTLVMHVDIVLEWKFAATKLYIKLLCVNANL